MNSQEESGEEGESELDDGAPQVTFRFEEDEDRKVGKNQENDSEIKLKNNNNPLLRDLMVKKLTK